jgi:hypothetical protein
VPHGETGKVIDVPKFSRDNGDGFPRGERLVGSVAQRARSRGQARRAPRQQGRDRKILPIEDMPTSPTARRSTSS